MMNKNTKLRLNLLNEDAKILFEILLIKSYEIGLNTQISQTYRTFTEQDKIYQQGRLIEGKIVTNAKAGMSMHHYRIACDLFIEEQGKAIFNKDYYKILWDICLINELDKKGMRWGGNFKAIKDYPHFEVSFGKNWRDIAIENNIDINNIENNNWKIYKNYL